MKKIHYTDLFLKDLWDEKHVNFTENKPSLHYCPRFFFNDTKNPPFKINKDVKADIIQDNSIVIEQRIALLTKNGVIGFILVLLILTLFLHPSLAGCVAVAIPISFA